MPTKSLQFSTSQVLSQSWKVLQQNWIFLLGVWAVTLAISFGIEILRTSMGDQEGILPGLFMLAAQVASFVVSIGAMKVILKVVRHQKTELVEIFTAGVKYLWQYFI